MLQVLYKVLRNIALAVSVSAVAGAFTFRSIVRAAFSRRRPGAQVARWAGSVDGIGLVPSDVEIPPLWSFDAWFIVAAAHVLYASLRSRRDRVAACNGRALLASALVWQRFVLTGSVRRITHLAILSVTAKDGCYGGPLCQEILAQRTSSARARAAMGPYTTPRCGCTAPQEEN